MINISRSLAIFNGAVTMLSSALVPQGDVDHYHLLHLELGKKVFKSGTPL
jgi:hypothetical protein